MPLNSQQRAIFVYLRSKDDHKSCTPAGAKLTDEYTHRTNKTDPCTISVTPPQLCTFFRKRTISSVEIADYPRRDEKILRNFDFVLPKFHFILPNFYFPIPWGISICSVEMPDFLGRLFYAKVKEQKCYVL